MSVNEPLSNTTTTNGLHNDGPVTPEAPPLPFDSAIFHSYLLSLLPPVIGATQEELGGLFDGEFDERVGRFASESGGALYVVKSRDEVEGASLHVLS
jgi:hypothetical protein